MSTNWFEDNPTRSIIIHTLVVAGTTWGIVTFLLDQRKENLYKTEMQLIEIKLDSNRVVENQLRARIDILEKENAKLSEQNYRYYEWISASPATLAYVNKVNAQLRDKVNDLVKQASRLPSKDTNQNTVEPTVYEFLSDRLNFGSAFVDKVTRASFCVTDVNTANEADGYYNLPGEKQSDFVKLKPGSSWSYSYNGKNYVLFFQEVDFPSSTYKVLIKQE